jgi:hypothetical protein
MGGSDPNVGGANVEFEVEILVGRADSYLSHELDT